MISSPSLASPKSPLPLSSPSSSFPRRRLLSPCRAAAATLYDVLGIPAGATGGQIKAAYRRLARACHPDAAGASADEFIRVHAAYATLSDPKKRAEYDHRVMAAAAAAVAAGQPWPWRPRRSWETDQCW